MAEPSPYAPSRTVEPATPPRPAGKPGAFLWAMFALTLAAPEDLWTPTASILFQARPPMLLQLSITATVLLVIWSYLSDRVPLLGTRREGYLLLASALSLAAWVAAALVPDAAMPLSIVTFALACGSAMGYAATSGALVEISQRQGTAGRLAAFTVALSGLADLVLSLGSAPLSGLSLGWTAGIGAAAALSVGLAVILSEDRSNTESPPPPPASMGIGVFLRARSTWCLLAIAAGMGLDGAVGSPLYAQVDLAHEWDWRAYAAVLVADVAGSLGYLFLCRRWGPGAVLRPSLLIAGIANFALMAVDRGDLSLVAATVAYGIPSSVATVAFTHLCLRAAATGREAIGFLLLVVIPWELAEPAGGLLRILDFSLFTLITLSTLGLVLATFLVPLLPASLTARPDGQPPAAP